MTAKRGRDDSGEAEQTPDGSAGDVGAKRVQLQAEGSNEDAKAVRSDLSEAPLIEDEEERIILPTSSSRTAVKQGRDCPYLDTISRQVTCETHACMHVHAK